jgi:CO/xanthine dehydrogenase Mo-binding subunit
MSLTSISARWMHQEQAGADAVTLRDPGEHRRTHGRGGRGERAAGLRSQIVPRRGRREIRPRPVELRLELARSRQGGDRAGGGEIRPGTAAGRLRAGIAYWATFNVTHVAQVAEVTVGEDGAIRWRVVCAVDCGQVVNPDTVVAQMEGGIAFGLTAALKAQITIDKGRTQQSNFNDYPLLPIGEMPAVEVYIVPSDRAPSGIGEMGVPPVAPAVANAVFTASGVRVRKIPILPEDLMA